MESDSRCSIRFGFAVMGILTRPVIRTPAPKTDTNRALTGRQRLKLLGTVVDSIWREGGPSSKAGVWGSNDDPNFFPS